MRSAIKQSSWSQTSLVFTALTLRLFHLHLLCIIVTSFMKVEVYSVFMCYCDKSVQERVAIVRACNSKPVRIYHQY